MKKNSFFETKIIYQDDKEFPKLLKKIKKVPETLYAQGNIKLLNKPSIAIVGSRNYSDYGKRMTKLFTRELVNEGFVIVSGLAIGIDKFAHEECIFSGGKTIAVIACGFNNIYPEENRDVYEKILQMGGCVISEYPIDVKAKKEYFPTRNRLISGLSLGTLVIEANFRSGTSITARYCIEQNRKLFCIPNSIENKNSTGTNNLIKKGANLVTKIEDITQAIGEISDKVQIETVTISEKNRSLEVEKNTNLLGKEYNNLSDKELIIYNNLKNRPKFADEIASSTGFSITDVNIILSMLELENYIVKLSTNMYKVKKR